MTTLFAPPRLVLRGKRKLWRRDAVESASFGSPSSSYVPEIDTQAVLGVSTGAHPVGYAGCEKTQPASTNAASEQPAIAAELRTGNFPSLRR